MILDFRYAILDDILKDLILLIGIEYPVSSIEYHSSVEPER